MKPRAASGLAGEGRKPELTFSGSTEQDDTKSSLGAPHDVLGEVFMVDVIATGKEGGGEGDRGAVLPEPLGGTVDLGHIESVQSVGKYV